MLLEGKRILITGVASSDSIAYAVAERAVLHGGEVVLAVFPRDREQATEAARGLPAPPRDILSADLTDPDDVRELVSDLSAHGPIDAALHAVAFAPSSALAGIEEVPAAAVELAFRTSTYSYATLARVLGDLAPVRGASLVGLDFDSSRAWPVYNWMGPCKAALRSLNQYLARDLGRRSIRTNLVAAGPLATRAATSIPDFGYLLESWAGRSPLPWNPLDARPVADAVCFLFSDMARAVTGTVLHVDGGVHAMQGAPAGAGLMAEVG